ncbi:glycosyltransferase family 4 protein [Tundrisphaera lichenicola]|uniref:glycosyltransferase family 4 protein n=1 Tax=Tundrisphaera lichenicola TaxID=2029860 RepID=UPI003EB70924
MRLTLVTETFAPQVNGVSRTLGQLVDHMERAGDEVQVIHPDYGEDSTRPHDIRVRSHALPFYREVIVPIPPFGKAHRAIDAFRPDVVHVATEVTLGLSALRYSLRKSIPTVSSFHTNFDQYCDHYHVGWAKPAAWRYLRWFHNRTRETYVPSMATIRDLEARGFERLVLWPRGVDGRLFRPDRPDRARLREALGFGPDHVVIGHVSRLAAEKNVGHLVKALREVGEARPQVRFLFVGDGPARAELEAEMGEKARFVGYQGGEALADHYAAADLFAFASLTETFGNVVLEALASGLPTVAIRAGGVGEIVRPGETGILVEPADPPSQMAGALIGLVDDPTLRREMAQAARTYALGQTWEAIMGRLRERYLAVASADRDDPVPTSAV